MSYPQTSPEQSVLNGQEYWRLFTPLGSSGDIYEADVSARAIVVGPQSDVSQFAVTYFDKQAPGGANSVNVGVDKPFVGRLDALANEIYQTGDRARLLISTNDLVPPAGFRPPSAGPGDVVEVIVPNIDALFYLTSEPGYPPQRTNRSHLFESLPGGGGAVADWFVVPFYGRRFAEITAKLLGIPATVAGPPLDVDVFGVNFSNSIADPSVADTGHQEILLGTVSIPGPAALGAGTSGSIVVTNRAFDCLEVRLAYSSAHPANAFNLHITTSDKI